MAGKPIGLVAAMPEEIRPLLRHAGKWQREKISGFTVFRFTAGDREVFLAESGIGAKRAAEATGAIIDAVSPGVILNFGFAGAVLPGPSVGDIILADRLLYFRDGVFTEQQRLHGTLPKLMATLIAEACHDRDFQLHCGTMVTTGEIVSKRKLAGLLPAGTIHPALDMETAAVARVADGAGIPMVSIRAISDGADEELGFSIGEITDREMNISTWRLFRTIAGKPGIIPQLIRLARNSKTAGENLAVAMMTLLKSPIFP